MLAQGLDQSKTEIIAPTRLQWDVLNLGSGRKPIRDAVNLDWIAETQPDVVHNLNETPWPFGSNTFREIHAYDVLEHLNEIPLVMEEIHRISCANAMIFITVPHFSCSNAFTDPTHKHYFSYFSFDYFSDDSPLSFYSHARFRIRSRKLLFFPTLLSKIVWRLANRYPAAYERKWTWMFPAWYLAFELQIIK